MTGAAEGVQSSLDRNHIRTQGKPGSRLQQQEAMSKLVTPTAASANENCNPNLDSAPSSHSTNKRKLKADSEQQQQHHHPQQRQHLQKLSTPSPHRESAHKRPCAPITMNAHLSPLPMQLSRRGCSSLSPDHVTRENATDQAQTDADDGNIECTSLQHTTSRKPLSEQIREITQNCSFSLAGNDKGQKFQGNSSTSLIAVDASSCNPKMSKPEQKDDTSPTVSTEDSPEPIEKTGNWRLKAVLEAWQDANASSITSPSRPGRVKTLVKAFESLMSFSNQQTQTDNEKRRGYPLQFSYHNIESSRGGNNVSGGPGHTEVDGDAEEYRDGQSDEVGDRDGVCEEPCSSETETDSGPQTEENCSDELSSAATCSEVETGKHSQEFSVGSFACRVSRTKSGSRQRKSQVSRTSLRRLGGKKEAVKGTDGQSRPQPQSKGAGGSLCCKAQPFKLRTEVRGQMKEQEFLERLRNMLAEEERLRIPLAQGLPWSTDEPEIPPKPPVKEITKPVDLHLRTEIRAMERAEFDSFIMDKLSYLEQRRLEDEKLRKMAEEEEIKKLRQEMVPKAQLMPYFDRPFRPRRSSKRPTIPKEPQFHYNNNNNNKQAKRPKCNTSHSS